MANKKNENVNIQNGEKPVELACDKSSLKLFKGKRIFCVNIIKGIEESGEEGYIVALRSFVKDIKPYLNQVREIDKDKLSDYAAAIYKIKVLSQGIFAGPFFDTAEEMEGAARGGRVRFLTKRNDDVVDDFECLILDIEKVIEEINEEYKLNL